MEHGKYVSKAVTFPFMTNVARKFPAAWATGDHVGLGAWFANNGVQTSTFSISGLDHQGCFKHDCLLGNSCPVSHRYFSAENFGIAGFLVQ